jgi:rRNA-processing protein FCF1
MIKTIRNNELNRFIFDSNIIDCIVNKKISFEKLESIRSTGGKFYVTHVQVDEINKCPEVNKRSILNLFMLKTMPEVIPTETIVLGYSRLGEAKFGNDEFYKKLLVNNNPKHIEDALIGEVAIKNNIILITEDTKFLKKVIKLGGQAISIDQFRMIYK